MPLKLAGILMKYMQLQGAQCPPADKTTRVFCSGGSLKGDLPVPQLAPQLSHGIALGTCWKGESIPQRGSAKHPLQPFVRKNWLERSVHVHVRGRQGSARAGSTQGFCKANHGAGLRQRELLFG